MSGEQRQPAADFTWDSYLRRLLASASTPVERLKSSDYLCKADSEKAPSTQSWADAVCDGEQEAFEKRLALNSWSLEDAERALRPHDVSSKASLPTWVSTLGDILQNIEIPSAIESKNIIGFRNQPYIFQELWIPLCEVPAEEVRTALRARGIDPEKEEAKLLFDALYKLLLGHVCRISSSAVYAEFAKVRSVKNALGTTAASMPGSTRLYHQFVLDVLRVRYRDLFEKYPVLARFIGTVCAQWKIEAEQVLSRWAADKGSFLERFGAAFSGSLSNVRTALSDRHNGGQRCMMLEFSSGGALMYKPRGLPSEQAFGRLCEALAAQERFSFDNKTPRVWNRESYGWEEVVSQKPCTERAEVERYFFRAGQLLCLTYVLGGKDFHHENIIACGEYPMLIDLEAMASHQLDDRCPLFSGASRVLYDSFFFDSVLSTSMLSVRVLDEEDRVWDLGGFTGGSEEQAFEVLHGWEMPNSDAVRPIRYEYPLESTENKVFLNGVRQHLRDYYSDFERGFTELYRNLATPDGYSLLEQCSEYFNNQNSRFLFRDTLGYTKLLQSLMTNAVMRSGDELWFKLERLWRTMSLDEGGAAYSKAVVAGEQMQLLELDVPVFYVSTRTTEMVAPGGDTPIRVFRAPADEEILNRARELDEAHLEKQLQSISLTLRTSSLHADVSQSGASAQMPAETVAPESLDESRCIEIACSLAEQLLEEAVEGADGSLAWLTVVANRRTMSTQIGPMPARLYDGLCGPAILFALLADLSSSSSQSSTMNRGLQGALHEIRGGAKKRDYCRALLYDGIGALSGVASIVYTLIYIYRVNGDQQLLSLATQYARLISKSQIEKDRYLDLTSGCAGAIRVLSLLEAIRPDGEIRDVIDFGRQELRRRAQQEEDCISWKTVGPTAVVGFAHGASGIAYALQEADAALGDSASEDLIRGALCFERRAFDVQKKNWRRSVEDAAPVCSNRWCEGAPGIGFSRLALAKSVGAVAVEDELTTAIQRSAGQESASLDQLCCGALGAVDFLLTTARYRKDAGCLTSARTLLARRLSTAASPANLACGLPPGVFPSPFFQGLTGIAYVFARMAKEGAYPSVLMLE